MRVLRAVEWDGPPLPGDLLAEDVGNAMCWYDGAAMDGAVNENDPAVKASMARLEAAFDALDVS